VSKFIIACGGTGGHLSPGIALAEALLAHGHEVTLFISHKRVDTRLVEKYPHLPTVRVPSAPFGWRPDVHLRFQWKQAQGLLFSRRFVRQFRPDAIIGFGGGVHKCIGMHFAENQVKLLMHHLLRRFEWQLATPAAADVNWIPICHPKDGLPVILRKTSQT